jgi:hypothetical protein
MKLHIASVNFFHALRCNTYTVVNIDHFHLRIYYNFIRHGDTNIAEVASLNFLIVFCR